MESAAREVVLVPPSEDVTRCAHEGSIPPADVLKHDSKDSVWVALFGKVYDLTAFIEKHPGGEAAILAAAGKDVTRFWSSIHKKEWLEEHLLPQWCLGVLLAPHEGAPALLEHEFERPQVSAKAEDVTYSAGENPKHLKRRMQRKQPFNMHFTVTIIDMMIQIQSCAGSKDSAMERLVSLAEERGDPNCTDQDGAGGSTPLLVAATLGSDEQVRRLVDANADPLYKTERGVTALHKFAARPLPDARAASVLAALIELQCSVNAVMMQGPHSPARGGAMGSG